MEIVDRKQIRAACFAPVSTGEGLTLRAVSIAAGVVGNVLMLTTVALLHMPAQRGRAAALESTHDAALAAREVVVMGAPIRRAVAPQHFAKFRSWMGHGATLYAAGCSSRSRGL